MGGLLIDDRSACFAAVSKYIFSSRTKKLIHNSSIHTLLYCLRLISLSHFIYFSNFYCLQPDPQLPQPCQKGSPKSFSRESKSKKDCRRNSSPTFQMEIGSSPQNPRMHNLKCASMLATWKTVTDIFIYK